MRTGIYADKRQIVLDNHSLQNYRDCPKKFKYRILDSLVEGGEALSLPQDTPPPIASQLLFGIAIHAGLDTLYVRQNVEAACDTFIETYQPVPEDPKRTPTRGCDILTEYADQYATELLSIKSVQTEIPFRIRLGSIKDLNGEEWEIYYGGVIDKLFATDERSLDPTRKLRGIAAEKTNQNNNNYAHLRERISTPAKLPNLDNDNIEIFRTVPRDLNTRAVRYYCMDHKTSSWQSESLLPAFSLSNQFMGYVAGAQQFLPAGAYCDTIIADVLCIWPKKNAFMRNPLTFTEERLNEFRIGILQTVRHMLMDYQDNRFPRHGRDACTLWNKPCTYFEICNASAKMREGVKSFNYSKVPWDTEQR